MCPHNKKNPDMKEWFNYACHANTINFVFQQCMKCDLCTFHQYLTKLFLTNPSQIECICKF